MTYPTPILHLFSTCLYKCCSFSLDVPKVLLSGKKHDFRKTQHFHFFKNEKKIILLKTNFEKKIILLKTNFGMSFIILEVNVGP